jgi:hypothetical protein
MSGTWRREGLILAPPNDEAWWRTHAQVPTVLPLSDRLWRIYFGARGNQPRSRILCVDVDPGNGFRVLCLHSKPVLEPGRAGTFDCDGVAPCSALSVGGCVYLYYNGNHLRADVPYQMGIGLAVSEDGLHFRRFSDGPVLSSGPRDPFSVASPCVRKSPNGFEMWYVSFLEWQAVDGTLEPIYTLRHTRSSDGVIWNLNTELALDFEDSSVAGLARPWVTGDGSRRRLWFSSRGAREFRKAGPTAYRLRCAVGDGRCQETEDLRFENPPLPGDWDSWMQAYGCFSALGDDLIMLYNGDDFGRGGFGYARLAGGAI